MTARRLMSDEQIAKAFDLRREGVSASEVARIIGVCRSTIVTYCKVGEPRKQANPERDAAIIADRLAGVKPKELAKKYGLSAKTLSMMTAEAWRESRPQTPAKKTTITRVHFPEAERDLVADDEAFCAAMRAAGGGSYASVAVKASSVPARLSAPFIGGGGCALADL